MLGILAGNLTGFGREVVTAALLGASREADIYLFAFALPELLNVLVLTIVAPALVPALSAAKRDAARLTSALALWLTASLVAVILVLELAAPAIVAAPGDLSSEEGARAIELMRLMLVAMAGLGVAAAASAALTARRQFAGPALLAAAYNVGFLVTAGLAYRPLGLIAFGWAVAAGTVLALLSLVAFYLRGGSGLRPAVRHPGVRRALGLALPVAVGYGAHHLAFFADRVIGLGLPGGELAAFNYAFRLALIVEQAIGIAVATVALPALAEHVAAGRRSEVAATLAAALRLVAILAWPAMGLLVVLAGPIVELVFQRGRFTSEAGALTAGALWVLAGGLLADTLAQPVWRYFYAVEAGRVVVVTNVAKTLLRVGLDLLLVPAIGYLGLAWSSTIGWIVQLAVLIWLADRQTGGLGRSAGWRGTGPGLLAGTGALAAAWLVRSLLPQPPGPGGSAWVVLASAGAAGLTFVALAQWLGVPEVRPAAGWLRRHLRSGHSGR